MATEEGDDAVPTEGRRNPSPPDEQSNRGVIYVVAAVVLGGLVVVGSLFYIGWLNERDEQALEDKAAAVIEARYNDDDMNATLVSPVTVSTTDDDVLIATWWQLNDGAERPMECTTPLKVSEDEKMFGFDPIPEITTPEEARDAEAICDSHPGLGIGLTMPEKSSPEEGNN